MAKLIQSAEYFVVGGPVQADRSCYIERRADQDLIQTIVDQRFAYVLASRGSGKSSLMIRAIKTLRNDARQAALVDLNQINARGESADASRWFYSVAHRIVRELRLRVELQSWWQERSALGGEQRFADFFADIVLANTSKPVTVFIDEIERAADLPFAAELFSVIRNCYGLRVSEPDYSRLNFVVLGVASTAGLCPDPDTSPFVYGDEIKVPDFTIEQCYEFAPGFELGEETARGLLDRIFGWTRGNPYLTQKVSRAVARRGGRLQDVERVVQELFLSSNALQDEPLLNHTRSLLTARKPTTRAALQLLAKVAKGQDVSDDPMSPAQGALELAGVVRTDAGRLVTRNRIYSAVFTERWAKSAMPVNWRGAGLAAAGILFAVLIPYWYMTYLPRPYIETLSDTAVTYEEAADAYATLHRLPGFAETADELFTQVIVALSPSIQTLDEVREIGSVLRAMGGHDALADQLSAEYWLRQARKAIDLEDRDAALVYAVEALPGAPQIARRLATHLIGADYKRLQRSFRLAPAPAHWAVDWSGRTLTVVDEARSVSVMPLDEPVLPSNGDSRREDSTAGLTALQPIPLIRELSVDMGGSAGEFDLQMVLDHPAPQELTVTLTAPSGASVRVPLSESYQTRDGLTLTSRSDIELGALADEQRQGVWRLALVDGKLGDRGVLHRWTLQFGDVSETWFGAPGSGTEIPDPIRTDEVGIALSHDGRFAVSSPSREGGVSSLAVWELGAVPSLRTDIHLEANAELVELTRDTRRLVAVTGTALSIWSVDSGALTGRIETQTEFVLPPSTSSEGSYIAIAERVEGGPPLFSLIRAEDGELVSSIEGVAGVDSWLLGPEARYLALLTPGREISIVDPRRGNVITELQLERAPRRVIPVPGEELLITIDTSGDVHAWRFALSPDGLRQVEDWRLGTTVDPDSISVAMNASTVAFATSAGHVAVHDLARGRSPLLLRAERPDDPIRTELAPDGSALLTGNGALLQLWSLDNRPAAEAGDMQLSAVVIGEQGRIVAMGYRGGYVRAQGSSVLGQATSVAPEIEFIGHRGAVRAIALNTGQNQIVSGGNDGVVRLWNLTSVSPTDALMRHTDGAIVSVTISRDGRWIASGAESSARIWNAANGAPLVEYPVNGMARALDFSDDGEQFAVGDSAGNLFIGRTDGAAPTGAFRADSGISSVAFSSSARMVATGDDVGTVRIWDPLATTAPPLTIRFRQPVRWLDFEPGDARLLVQTDQWIHRVNLAGDSPRIEESRLLPINLAPGAAYIEAGSPRVRLVGGIDVGRPTVAELDFGEMGAGPLTAQDLAQLERDWLDILGFGLNAQGVAEPILH